MKLRAAVNGLMSQYKLKGYRLDVAVDRSQNFVPVQASHLASETRPFPRPKVSSLVFLNGNGRRPLGTHAHLPGSLSHSEVLPGIRT